MKKVFMLLIASAALTMTACGGKDEKAATAEAATSDAATSDAATSDAAVSDEATSDATGE